MRIQYEDFPGFYGPIRTCGGPLEHEMRFAMIPPDQNGNMIYVRTCYDGEDVRFMWNAMKELIEKVFHYLYQTHGQGD